MRVLGFFSMTAVAASAILVLGVVPGAAQPPGLPSFASLPREQRIYGCLSFLEFMARRLEATDPRRPQFAAAAGRLDFQLDELQRLARPEPDALTRQIGALFARAGSASDRERLFQSLLPQARNCLTFQAALSSESDAAMRAVTRNRTQGVTDDREAAERQGQVPQEAPASSARTTGRPSLGVIWSPHRLDTAGCKERVLGSAAATGLVARPLQVSAQINPTMLGSDMVVRCDIPGFAVFVTAGPEGEHDGAVAQLQELQRRFGSSPAPGGASLPPGSPTATGRPSISVLWSPHRVDTEGCKERVLQSAAALGLAARPLQVSAQINPTMPGSNMVVRCNIPGFAVFVAAGPEGEHDRTVGQLQELQRRFGLGAPAGSGPTGQSGSPAAATGSASQPEQTQLAIGPLNPTARFGHTNESLRCREQIFHLLEPDIQVCELNAQDERLFGQQLVGSHVWLVGDRVASFELAFPSAAYSELLSTLSARFGQPRPTPRADPTESSVGWRAGGSRLSITNSPRRNLVIVFGTYRSDYSEAWGNERAFAGYYTAEVPLGRDPLPSSFAGCYFTMSAAASEAFYRAHPEARQIQPPDGRPHYWLEVRGTRRDVGPGSEHAGSNIFPCEIRATGILSSRRLERVEFYPGRTFETEERLRARRAASDVILLKIDRVFTAGSVCEISGRAMRVEQGTAFRAGAGGTLFKGHVPCGRPPSLGPRQIAVGDLRKDGLIRLHLQPGPSASPGAQGPARMVLLDAELVVSR